MHIYVSFSVSGHAKLDTMLNAAEPGPQRHYEPSAQEGALQESYKTWFGAETPARCGGVTDVIGLMDFALSSGHVKWVYSSPDCAPATNAAPSLPGGWRDGAVHAPLIAEWELRNRALSSIHEHHTSQ